MVTSMRLDDMPMILLKVNSKVDPRDLAVNRRYRKSQSLKPEVEHAMLTLQGEVFDYLEGRSLEIQQRMACGYDNYSLSLHFYFPTTKSDIDGPVKHAIDAMQAGINQWLQTVPHGRGKFNDNKIYSMTLRKLIGDPGMSIFLYGYGGRSCL